MINRKKLRPLDHEAGQTSRCYGTRLSAMLSLSRRIAIIVVEYSKRHVI